MKKFLFFLTVFFIVNFLFSEESDDIETQVEKTGSISAVYLTGIGCPNCAKTDPVILQETLLAIPELFIFEYEVYKQKEHNREIAISYMNSFFPEEGAAIPALIVNNDYSEMGKWNVFSLAEEISDLREAPFIYSDGKKKIKFEDIDIASLPGQPKIWHKNRVLIKNGEKGSNEILKKLLTSESIEEMLNNVLHKIENNTKVEISKGEIVFDKGVKIDDWTLLWRYDETLTKNVQKKSAVKSDNSFNFYGIISLILISVFSIFYLIDRYNLKKAGILPKYSESQKNGVVVLGSILFLFGFFMLAKIVSPDFLKEMGYSLPLPLFTFLIAMVDGFNPCNMFVLTFLLALMVSVSHSRLRIYMVGYTFVAVVYVIYFLFMAAWLNIFKYIGFIDPLRITIAIIALVAGMINCKELFFFKKGVSLTTSDKGADFLQKKARKMKDTIKNGTMPMLITSSIVLAFFASLIELPCTAGFPIVYTSVLSGMDISTGTFSYYFWIALYNVFYVIPLAVIIGIFGYTFRGKAISEKTVQRIKFIGGFIMLLLGIVLLVNPGMIGLGM